MKEINNLSKYEFIGYLNTREWAILTWVFILFFIMLFHSQLRNSLMDIIKVVGRIIIQPVFIVFLVYQIVLVAIAIKLHIQGITVSVVKDYLILFFFTVVPFLTKVQFKMFWKALFQSIGFGALVQLILSTYTFPYIFEFILVPVTVCIVAVSVQAESENLEQVSKFLNSLLGIIGILLIAHAGYSLICNINIIFHPNFWEGYVIEPITWLANIPLIILAVPMVQFDIIDNFRIKKKTVFRLLWHSIWFLFIRLLYLRLILLNVKRYVVRVHFGGFMKRRIQITLRRGTPVRQARMVQHLYQYMLASRVNYLNKNRIIPIRVECREMDEIDLKIPVYEMSGLLDECKLEQYGA